MLRTTAVITVGTLLFVVMWAEGLSADEASPHAWTTVFRLSPPARIDAVADLGGGRVIVGTRSGSKHPIGGAVAVSEDFGKSWTEYGRVIDGLILNLLALDPDTVLATTQQGDVWKSTDGGKSWRKTQHVSDIRLYSMALTEKGTVLTASYDHKHGGRVFRSTDGGETWADLGVLSPKGLYRFQKVRDGVLLNGLAGHLYKSVDDGMTWSDIGQISEAPLYPIEALPTGVALLGDEQGKIFRSTDDGLTWETVADVGQPLDDFVWVDGDLVYLSSYLGTKHLFVSHDAGASWKDIGPTPDRDVLDHVVRVRGSNPPVAVGGTTEGRILRLSGSSPQKIERLTE